MVKVLRDNFGSKWLTEISYLDLKTFRDTWRTTPIKSGTKKRTDATVNRYLVVFGHMLNKAVEWGMLDVSPFKKGSRLILKENNLRDRFLSQEEIEALLGACSPHLLPVVEMALHTGMRKGELLSMQWKQVKGGLIYLRETKSKKPRKIPIDERAGQIFKQLRARNKRGSPYVFLGPDGKPLADVKKAFLGTCRRAGIDNFQGGPATTGPC